MLKVTINGGNTLTDNPKIAFLGVGWIGKNRLDAIAGSKAAEIRFIAEPDENIRQTLNKEYNSALYGTSIQDIINCDGIDGVVIATPNSLHAQQSIELLNQGIPVFCQKPLGRNTAETESVVKAAQKNNKLLGVDFSYRYTKAFQSIYNVVRSGEIGHIFAADLVFHNAYGPEKSWFFNKEHSGGGCAIDLGIHLIDLALYTLNFPAVGEVNSKLYSKGTRIKNSNEVEDYAAVLIDLEDDTSMQLNCSWNLSAGQGAVIEVSFHGSKGGVSLKNVNGSFFDFKAEMYRGTKTEVLENPPDDWGGRAVINWIEKLAAGSEFDNSAFEFIHTSRVIDKIYGIES